MAQQVPVAYNKHSFGHQLCDLCSLHMMATPRSRMCDGPPSASHASQSVPSHHCFIARHPKYSSRHWNARSFTLNSSMAGSAPRDVARTLQVHCSGHASTRSPGHSQQQQPPMAVAQDPRLQGLVLPKHLAVVMDGNYRWALRKGLSIHAGHQEGSGALNTLVACCSRYGIKALTVYAFSSENWERSAAEVRFLMQLFEATLESQLQDLQKQDIQLVVVGDRSRLPATLQSKLQRAEEKTSSNTGMYLTVALSYSGQQDLVQAARQLAALASQGLIDPNQIDAHALQTQLSTSEVLAAVGPPDLLIRTSGEQRVSNFLLWELAYTELYFTSILWPDFDEVALLEALADYTSRKRKFGRRAEY